MNTSFTKIVVQALSMVALAMTLAVAAPSAVAAGNKTISNGYIACNVVTPRGVVRKLCQANVRIYYCAGYEAGRLIYKNAPRSKQCPKGFSLKRR